MESSMKQVVVEEPLDVEAHCCSPSCCLACCKSCCCCMPSCAACCPKCAGRCCGCRGCTGCTGCTGCHGCAGCLKSCLCFVPRLLCYLPRKLLGCHHLKCLLIVVVVVVLLVVIIAGALLMWLHVARQHADAVLQMTVEGLEGGEAWPWIPAGWEEEAATFYVDGGAGSPATVIYDYKNLLISYRSWLHQACYVTRMDEDNIQGLDAVTAAFRHRQAEERLPAPLADRSLLSTTANILCSVVPIYWA